MSTQRVMWSFAIAALSVFAVPAISPAAAEDKPAVIRIANPGVGIGGRPVVGSSPWSLLHIKGVCLENYWPARPVQQ